jgi:hypothetical protein
MMKEISMHILDIAQNSVTAGSDLIDIDVDSDHKKDLLSVTISDNGCGMNEKMVKDVTDPFVTTRTERRVGLGLPFFQESALSCGGSFKLKSRRGIGTVVEAKYRLSHIDTPPLGDIASTMLALVIPNEKIDFTLEYKVNDQAFDFDTRKIRAALGEGLCFTTPEVFEWIHDFLYQGIAEINGGELQE